MFELSNGESHSGPQEWHSQALCGATDSGGRGQLDSAFLICRSNPGLAWDIAQGGFHTRCPVQLPSVSFLL